MRLLGIAIVIMFFIATIDGYAYPKTEGILGDVLKSVEDILTNSSKLELKTSAETILPEDDAYHGPYAIPTAEWWYFDAIFNNGYALHAGITIYSIYDQGLLRYTIEIYKNEKILVRDSAMTIFLPFLTSKERPTIVFKDKVEMSLDEESFKKEKKWVYRLHMEIDQNGVDLLYIGTTEGWKCEGKREGWVVPLPKAVVHGELKIDGLTIKVKGFGYHDHNWNYTFLTGIESKGWFWGRINGKTLSITWAKIRNRYANDAKLAILNVDMDGYTGIDQRNISISASKFVIIDGQRVPSRINIIIKSKDVKANLTLLATSFHPSVFLTLHYCRFFVKAYGYISIGSYREELNGNLQIAECMDFT